MKTKFLIIGGGITSLAFAQHLDSQDYLICEALDDVGGYCQTIKQDGFIWDYSGHFFHFRQPEIENELVSRIGQQNVVKVERSSKIYYSAHLIDFPFQKNIHQLPYEEFIDCLVDLVDKQQNEPSNFKEMLYAKFGKSITEKFLIPYNEKLYATDLTLLDVDAMGRFFPYADTTEIIKGFRKSNNKSYNSTFTYPVGGAIEYVRAIQQDIPGENISLNNKVINIDTDKHIAYTSNTQIEYQYLVSAAPFPRLIKMANITYNPELYSYNQVLVFNLGFDHKGPEGIHWIYFPGSEFCFYRVGFYDNILGTDRMSLYVEIGYPFDKRFTPKEIETIKDQTLLDLRKAGIIKGQKLISSHKVILDPAYVHITKESMRDVEEKKDFLAKYGIYSIGRYGSWTYCSIEDNIIEARKLADHFNSI